MRKRLKNQKVLTQFKSVPEEFWRSGEQPQARTVKELQMILRRLDPSMLVKSGGSAGVKIAVIGFGTEALDVDVREADG